MLCLSLHSLAEVSLCSWSQSKAVFTTADVTGVQGCQGSEEGQRSTKAGKLEMGSGRNWVFCKPYLHRCSNIHIPPKVTEYPRLSKKGKAGLMADDSSNKRHLGDFSWEELVMGIT